MQIDVILPDVNIGPKEWVFLSLPMKSAVGSR